MRHILILLFLAVSFLVPRVSSGEETGIHRFYLDYGIVKHTLKGDQGVFDELMALFELDRQAADFIAEFWWTKAKKECNEFIKEIIERSTQKITLQTTEKEKEDVFKEVKKEADQCIFGVYYDNWDAINKMIVDKLRMVKKSREKN